MALFRQAMYQTPVLIQLPRHEIQGELGSGNFLALAELVAKYDPVLKELLDKPKGSVCYLSPTIQNKVVALLGKPFGNIWLKQFRRHRFSVLLATAHKDISKV